MIIVKPTIIYVLLVFNAVGENLYTEDRALDFEACQTRASQEESFQWWHHDRVVHTVCYPKNRLHELRE